MNEVIKDSCYYDPKDKTQQDLDHSTIATNPDGYPSKINHTIQEVPDDPESKPIKPPKEPKSESLDLLDITNVSKPKIETQIFATSTWHRVIHQNIDLRHLRPYLGWKLLPVVKKTLQKTT